MEKSTSIVTKLPRLALIADVSPERAGGGALLLYRLLKEYPADRLLVIYNSDSPHSGPETRLPDVEFRDFPYRISRLVRNRLNPCWPMLQGIVMNRYAKAVASLVQDFAPEAILTVPHWYLWFTAAAVAERLNLPLHLIVHDDWPSYTTFRWPGRIWDAVRWGCRRSERPIYRQSVSRLCVSPGMEEHCAKWFGAAGTVLYPTWGDDSPAGKVRVRTDPGKVPVVAFCGHIHQDGTITLLVKLANILAQLGGHLDLYTMLTVDRLSKLGLRPPVVRVQGFFPAAEMGERVGSTAHALFLPASFEAREREDVATLFPSKLADYTLIGLPVIVWGPEYSSASRWAAENPDAAVRVTDSADAAVKDAISRVFADPAHATRIATNGIEAGQRYFDLSVARNTLYSALTGSKTPAPPS